ncbi:MAG: hypothetical protein JWP81_3569 [Ferruginibacter sp.]|nr:hypothetical protein [Ferruginibacter sp.]
MKNIETGICPGSIDQTNGTAVFVYCNRLTKITDCGFLGLKSNYAIEYGTFFPHGRIEIAAGEFFVSDGHTAQSTIYGDESSNNCFQIPEEVLQYSKNKVMELRNELSDILKINYLAPDFVQSCLATKIELAAWLNFYNNLEDALVEHRVDTFIHVFPA